MQKYTLTVLVNEKVSEADRTGIFEAIKKDFGALIKEDFWGVRSLSYDIKHMNKAFYAYFEFENEPVSVITLDKHLRLNEDIIRYLIVRKKVTRDKKQVTKKIEEKKEEVIEEKRPLRSARLAARLEASKAKKN